MVPRLLLAGFLVAHASIHAGFVSRPPVSAGGPPWPFQLGHSWLLSPLGVDQGISRMLGLALVVAVAAGYGAAALASLGVVPVPLFGPGLIAGSLASMVLLGLFFHPWLVLGIAIDVALLWVAGARWMPAETGW